jgi:hypothetical protein
LHFDDVPPLQIYAWLDSLVEKYPGVVTPIVGGESYEGRQIRGVKVSYKTGNPGVALEGGVFLYLAILLRYMLRKTLKKKKNA